jgi:hypothetical protein
MPGSVNIDLLAKAFKIEDKNSSEGMWLSYDSTNHVMKTSRVNDKQSYVGDFMEPVITPTQIFIRQNYPSLTFTFDFNLGSNSVITSEKYGILAKSIYANTMTVSYSPVHLTDTFRFLIYSADNSSQKTIFKPISISTADVVPLNLENNPTINTLGNTYTGLTMLFSSAVDAGTVTTFSTQSSVSNVTFANGKCTFDYTTPTSDTTDKLIFTSLKAVDIQAVNQNQYFYEITNLLVEPTFLNWVYTPASQNFPYTNTDALIAVFSKSISSCTSITASSGTPTTIIPQSINGNQVKFNWTSLATGNVTFTFNGLAAVDGSIDASVNGLTVAGPVILNEPSTIVGWVGQQPTDANTQYNVSVNFNKQLSISRTPVITTSDNSTVVFNTISGSQINFSVTTLLNPDSVVYTFNNVAAVDGSIKNNATISVGAKINLLQVETDLANTFVTISKLVKLRSQKVKITLSKPISGTLSFVPNLKCTFGPVTMINTSTAQFTLTPTDVNDNSLDITTTNILAQDGSQSTLSYTFSLVNAQTVVNLFEAANKNTPKSSFDVGTQVALSLEVSKDIGTDLSGTTITCSDAVVSDVSKSTILSKYYYNFNFTPTAAGTGKSINVNNAKDIDNFIYTLYANNLSFISYDTSWTNILSTGDRRSLITVTGYNLPNLEGGISFLVDGVTNTGQGWTQNLNSTSRFVFDFNTPKVINGFKFYGQRVLTTTWVFAFEGSNDAASWTTLVPDYNFLNNVFAYNYSPYPNGGAGFTFTNANQYRYYQFRWVSGTGDSDWTELQWKIV